MVFLSCRFFSLAIIILLLHASSAFGHRLLKDIYPLGISGYVNHQLFVDNHLAVGQAADAVIFLPAPEIRDPDGYNIADSGKLGQASFITRFRANIAMNPMGETKPFLFFESDFFGNTNILQVDYTIDTLNILRLRHAVGFLEWGNNSKSFIYGYTWHPMYMFDCCPNNLSFNRGTPLAFVSRAPQVAFSYHAPIMDVTLVASSQIDFINLGPRGGISDYIRHAVVPDLTGLLKFFVKSHFFGCAVDYKRLVPRLVTNKGYKAYEHIDSGCFSVFAVVSTDKMQIKTQWFYAQNANNLGVLGGYAVSAIDPSTDRRIYTNLAYSGWWLDFSLDVKKHWEVGLLGSVIFNHGAHKPIIQSQHGENMVYSFLQTVSRALRISPRLRYMHDRFDIGMEVEYVRSCYGTLNAYGKAVQAVPSSNFRTLLVVTYLF